MTLNDIQNFFNQIKPGDLYNEASVQYELGCYLRGALSNSKIHFERNISYLNIKKGCLPKSEMDLLVEQNSQFWVIEIKAPLNQAKARPVTVFEWIEDLKFLEKLKSKGYSGFSIFITDQQGYKLGSKKTGKLLTDIRAGVIHGTYKRKSTSTVPKDKISLSQTYNINWFKTSSGFDYLVFVF